MTTATRMGLTRIADAFVQARSERRLALVVYLMAGYPDLATSALVARTALDAGADLLELGVPFSDPLADGTTIQRASERALATGTRLADIVPLAAALLAERDAPLLLMGYTNPLLRYGLERLVSDARAAGIAGLIVPDLPHEEAEELDRLTTREGLALISLFAPTTNDQRLASLVPRARGFAYCVSLTGVTGARAVLAPDIESFVARVRRHAKVPIVVGFGIARPEHVRWLRRVADGVVVGSAIVDAIGRDDPASAVGDLVRSLREACG